MKDVIEKQDELVTYNMKISKNLLDRFKVISRIKGETQVDALNGMIRDYIVKNTVEANEIILGWNKK